MGLGPPVGAIWRCWRPARASRGSCLSGLQPLHRILVLTCKNGVWGACPAVLPRLHSRNDAFASARGICRYIIASHQFEPFILNPQFADHAPLALTKLLSRNRAFASHICVCHQKCLLYVISKKALFYLYNKVSAEHASAALVKQF